ncbi:protocadherin alpha-3-like [Fundulus diaphanus]
MFEFAVEQRKRVPGGLCRYLAGCVLVVHLWCAVSAQLRYSISEEVNGGTVVGNIAKDLGLDKSTLKERKYRVVSSDTDPLFHVNQNDGILYVRRKIDREAVCSQSSTCLLNVKTVMENPLEVHYVRVEVLDINDHSPAFQENETTLEISESVFSGARFQLKAARDPDSGHFSVQQYKLNQNEHFRLEVKDKGDDGKIPVLVVQKPLDRETAARHSLVLTALDGGKPPKTGSMNIKIDILDVNDNVPVFSSDTYSVTLRENAPLGTTVVQVNATDLDDGSNGEVIYSLAKSMNQHTLKLFDINPITGEVTVKALIDYEERDKYEIEIEASDKGFAPLTTEKSVSINIIDVNDNAPEMEVTSFSSSIPEDSRLGTTVALISVNDLDSGLNGKVVCSMSEDISFTLSPTVQDTIYSLITKSLLDREKQSHYDLTIFAKDAGQPSMSSEKTISIVVSDVNDNSPKFVLSPYNFYLTEANEPGASVFSVKAFDCDDRDNALISYQIVRDGSDNNRITSFLNINSETGNVVALKSFDFETLKTFQFQVVASDSGTPSLSSNVTVNVFILDQNDNAPVILYPVSSNGSAEGVEEIPRNVNAGHLVTKVRAYDADIGYNGWLLFSLQEVSDHSLFGLDRYTGQIRTLRSFTETDEAEHKLVILVKDNGNVSLSATATVIVKLVEPKEAFAASDVKSAAKDDEDNNVTFYLMITLGSVSVLFIISIIVLIAMQCSKSPDYTSKYLQETNYDGTLCHSIQYRSGDKRYMLVGPRMSIGSTIVPGSHANTLVLPDRRRTSEEVRL